MTVQPLPYHVALVDYFRSEEPEMWEWFSSPEARRKAAESLRLELLKSTYRLPEPEHGRLYELGREAAERLQVDAPLTFYQAVDHGVMNAGLSRCADEAHLVLCGPIQEKLGDDELLALLGHELSHLKLWSGWEGQFLIVDELIAALADEETGNETFAETERLFQLYNEIFCDRGALAAVGGDCLVVIAVLIRLETSLASIRPESFLEQVDEIIQEHQVSKGATHPEAYIRAKAIQLWAQRNDADRGRDAGLGIDEQIALMLEGPAHLERLDLVGRRGVRRLTRRLLNTLLQPGWMRTETNLNHAKLFFPDYGIDPDDTLDSLADAERYDESILNYLCYVMLDFATTDRSLEETPLALAVDTARRLGMEERLAPLIQKELRIRKRQYAQIVQQAAATLSAAAASPTPDSPGAADEQPGDATEQ